MILSSVIGLLVSVSGVASDFPAGDVYSSHEDWFFARQGAVFTPADKLASFVEPIGTQGQRRLTWRMGASGDLPGTVMLQGSTLVIKGRRVLIAKVMRFPGEAWIDLGHRASLYVHGADLCIEGVPPTASGRAQRHVQVLFSPGALGPRTGRAKTPVYQLPSLFASCAGIRRDGAGQVHVPQASYVWRDGVDEAVGLTWTDHVLTVDGFKATDSVWHVEFIEPGNVYRFRLMQGATGAP